MMKTKPNFRQALLVKREKVVLAACIYAGTRTDENRDSLFLSVAQFQQANRDYELAERERQKGKR